LRLAPELLGGELVRRRAEVVVGALGVFGRNAAEERRVRRRMRAGVGVLQLQVRQHRDVVLHRRQRAEDRRQGPELVLAGGSPARAVAAHGDEDEAQAAHGGGRRRRQRGQGGDHRVQQRQRQRGPDAAQKRPPRQRFLEDDHGLVLIWNGVLWII